MKEKHRRKEERCGERRGMWEAGKMIGDVNSASDMSLSPMELRRRGGGRYRREEDIVVVEVSESGRVNKVVTLSKHVQPAFTPNLLVLPCPVVLCFSLSCPVVVCVSLSCFPVSLPSYPSQLSTQPASQPSQPQLC